MTSVCLSPGGSMTEAAIAKAGGSADELRAALAEPVVKENLTTEYDQTALELCNVCGWKAVIPTEGCLSCEREKQLMKKPPAEPAVEPVAEVAWDGVNPNVSFIKFLPTGAGLPVGTKLYTSPPPPAECKFPMCQTEEYQQMLAAQVARELIGVEPVKKGLFIDLIAQHPGLAEELAAITIDAPAEPAPVPLLSDEEVAQCIKDASKGSAIKRDGSTSQRIVRSAEQLVRRKAGL